MAEQTKPAQSLSTYVLPLQLRDALYTCWDTGEVGE